MNETLDATVAPVASRPSAKLWLGIGLIGAGVAIVYWQTLARLIDAWVVDGNYSHGFIIPPLAAYFAWERRRVIARAMARTSARRATGTRSPRWECRRAARSS